MRNKCAHDPAFWFRQAAELDRAARLIWAAAKADFAAMSQLPGGSRIRLVNLQGAFWLNAGSALENLLKGKLIARTPDLVVDGRIRKSLRTHNLLKLSRMLDCDLQQSDAFYLWVATQCVVWAGRYPAPIDGLQRKPPAFSEADFIAYDHLYRRFAPDDAATVGHGAVYERLV